MKMDMLKPEEFDAHIDNNTCRIAFIGMSNCGKSFRSKVLQQELGFQWYHVDEEIQKALGFKNMDEISSWIGYPSSPGYEDREKKYLELENNFTKEASMQTDKNLVFDTTGSVAQLDKDTLEILGDNCLIIHLDVGENSLQQMIDRFFREPKPVAWGDFFSINLGESEETALRRQYPTLLSERLKRYRALAHVNISANEMHDRSGEETLRIIRQRLRV
ncbi:hypothetical protein HY969_00320 [Candidatus Kaiserbacteria bacterium]|nr:hypothetical protein [Candidatus Kaiserbacteria bacterium]